MNGFVKLPLTEQAFYFEQASANLGLSPEAVEKDFWVVWVLDRLFRSELLGKKTLFKGGTSLSKVFGLIRRFSEDIDLILDWREVVQEDPNIDRSKTKQDKFNKTVPVLSQQYIAEVFLPEVIAMLEGVCVAEIEVDDPNVINIQYPSSFKNDYLLPEIRLEIGPLALWVPNAEYEIRSYVAETFPGVLENSSCMVRAIKAERTFWEKATILHAEAFRPESKLLPLRYSRHYYDLAMMAGVPAVKAEAFNNLDLLRGVAEFKSKFYPVSWGNYDSAVPGTFRLMPASRNLKPLANDYARMQVMFFGDIPAFDDLMDSLRDLEVEINAL